MRYRWRLIIAVVAAILLFSTLAKWLVFQSLLAPDGSGRQPVDGYTMPEGG